MLSKIFTIVSCLCLASCLSIKPKLSAYAYVKPYKSDSLEIEIPYVSSYYGNMNGISFKKYHSRESNWIYMLKQQKSISADNIILIKEKGKRRAEKDIKGEIKISDSVMTINLQTPWYKRNTLKHWANYELNGIYILH